MDILDADYLREGCKLVEGFHFAMHERYLRLLWIVVYTQVLANVCDAVCCFYRRERWE